MGMAEDVSSIRTMLEDLSDTKDETYNIVKMMREKLNYDIEPKLDKALSGSAAVEPAKQDISRMLWLVRQIAVEVREGRKIEGIKCIRELTNAGLKEAKDTMEWLEAHSPYSKKEAE